MGTCNDAAPGREPWQRIHDEAVVWLLHDHFYHRLEANLGMRQGGVTAKTVVPFGDLAIYNDGDGEDDLEFYHRTLGQTDGWAKESLVRLERTRRLYESRPDRFLVGLNAEDVLRAKAGGKAAIFFGCEGCKAFEGRLELLTAFPGGDAPRAGRFGAGAALAARRLSTSGPFSLWERVRVKNADSPDSRRLASGALEGKQERVESRK